MQTQLEMAGDWEHDNVCSQWVKVEHDKIWEGPDPLIKERQMLRRELLRAGLTALAGLAVPWSKPGATSLLDADQARVFKELAKMDVHPGIYMPGDETLNVGERLVVGCRSLFNDGRYWTTWERAQLFTCHFKFNDITRCMCTRVSHNGLDHWIVVASEC